MRGESLVYTSQEALEITFGYLAVLKGTDLEDYRAAAGTLDDVLHHNTPTRWSGENFTYHAIRDLEAGHEATGWRAAAASHVIRAMIQGKKIPVELFEPIINEARDAIDAIRNDHTGRSSRKLLKREINDVLSFPNDEETVRRAMEARRHIGDRPRLRDYGRLALAKIGIGY